jgi:hypothetical protein
MKASPLIIEVDFCMSCNIHVRNHGTDSIASTSVPAELTELANILFDSD